MSNRVKNADQTWIVYGHYESDGTLVYLGSGQVHRAFQFIKRSKEHYAWLVASALKNGNNQFVKILFDSDDFAEVRFIEGRLIAQYNPKFNKNLNKITFADLKYTIKQTQKGESIRGCAKDIGVYHNNLCQLLKLPYCENDYSMIGP